MGRKNHQNWKWFLRINFRGGDTQKKYFHFLICYTKWYVNEFKHGFMSVSLLETAILKNEIERKSINFNSMFGSWNIRVFLKIGWLLNANILVLISLLYILSSLHIGNKWTIQYFEIKWFFQLWLKKRRN